MLLLPEVSVTDFLRHYEGDGADLGRHDYIETKLTATVAKLSARYGRRVKARLDSGALPLALYQSVIAEVVLRVLRNPEGLYREEEGNYSYARTHKVASGLLHFTDENLMDLLGETQPFVGTVPFNQWGRHEYPG